MYVRYLRNIYLCINNVPYPLFYRQGEYNMKIDENNQSTTIQTTPPKMRIVLLHTIHVEEDLILSPKYLYDSFSTYEDLVRKVRHRNKNSNDNYTITISHIRLPESCTDVDGPEIYSTDEFSKIISITREDTGEEISNYTTLSWNIDDISKIVTPCITYRFSVREPSKGCISLLLNVR